VTGGGIISLPSNHFSIGCQMCCKLDVQDKEVRAYSFPEGWTFFFQDPKQLPPKHPGRMDEFVLSSPSGKFFYCVEAAVAGNKTALQCINSTAFLRFAGLIVPDPETHCGKCALCSKPPCGKCFACCTRTEDCFQTVCVGFVGFQRIRRFHETS